MQTLGAGLIVPLPLTIEDYLTDFHDQAAQAKFLSLLELAQQIVYLPPTTSREDAYLAAGMYIIEHCDVLIALWDGNSPQGKGGTGEIVAEARLHGMPIVWILAYNNKPGSPPPVFKGEQGVIRFERL